MFEKQMKSLNAKKVSKDAKSQTAAELGLGIPAFYSLYNISHAIASLPSFSLHTHFIRTHKINHWGLFSVEQLVILTY